MSSLETVSLSIGVDEDLTLRLTLGWSHEFLSRIPIHVALEGRWNRMILETGNTSENLQQMLSEKVKSDGSNRASLFGDIECQWMLEPVEAEIHGRGR